MTKVRYLMAAAPNLLVSKKNERVLRTSDNLVVYCPHLIVINLTA